MTTGTDSKICRRCSAIVTEKYCGNCGEHFVVKRITLHSLLHDVFHFFTHLDKGFGYTVKQLITAPGFMQRRYIEGDRSRYQKPFSMFFICGTIDALLRYWINSILMRYYQTGNELETHFFHQYFVLTHIVLMPVYILIAWSLFYRSKYNYAEIGILILYNISFLFLIAAFIFLPKLIWHFYDTTWYELAFFSVYNTISFLNFFNDQKKWVVIIKSLIIIVATFFIANYVEDILSAITG